MGCLLYVISELYQSFHALTPLTHGHALNRQTRRKSLQTCLIKRSAFPRTEARCSAVGIQKRKFILAILRPHGATVAFGLGVQLDLPAVRRTC